MANYDKQLERMMFLMGYDNSLNESKKTNSGIEYHTTAADGKEYGIIKEGTKYYIKTTTPENKMIAESYDYINGFTNRSETRYNSYNEATKQLELRLMSINESLGKHEDVSVYDMKRNEKTLGVLTEEARKELDRMHSIFENSYILPNKYGKDGNGEPFTKEASAKLDKDMKETCSSAKNATPDNKEVSEPKMDDTSMRKGGDESCGLEKAPKPESNGVAIASEKKSGGKVVRVNEGMFEEMPEEFPEEKPEEIVANDTMAQEPDDFDMQSLYDELGIEGEESEEPMDSDELTGQPMDDTLDNDTDLDELLREFNDIEVNTGDITPTTNASIVEEDVENGGEEGLKSFNRAGNGDNGVGTEKTMDRLKEGEEVSVGGAGEKESKIVGPDKVMDGPRGEGSEFGGKPTMAKMDEAIDRITEMVFESLTEKKDVCPECGESPCTCGLQKHNKIARKNKKENLAEMIQRIVNEEVTRLDAWGKHPRYGKEPMSLPNNSEVLAGTAEKDWNDDSTKGSERYGKKIGNGAPFDKAVDMLTDQVLANLKESLKGKK